MSTADTHRTVDAVWRIESAKVIATLARYVRDVNLAEELAQDARARTAEETDWFRIARLYEDLVRLTGSPVVELNRAVAVAMALGSAEGLEIADALLPLATLKSYHLLPRVRGDLLFQLGRFEEARAEFERAAALTGNSRERTLLLARAAACGEPSTTVPRAHD